MVDLSKGISDKRYKIRPRVQLMTNRKWHVRNSLSVTFNHPEPGFQGHRSFWSSILKSSCKGKLTFWGFFFSIFTMGNAIADCEMFLIRMQKLDHVSLRQMCHWKARFVGFLVIYSFSRSTLGSMTNCQKRNDYSTKMWAYAAKLQA